MAEDGKAKTRAKSSQGRRPVPEERLSDPRYYRNRELSWLEFNRRVLEEAQDPTVPLLERLKFLAIFASNLDEFFMVRVGALRRLVAAEVDDPDPSGMSPQEQLEKISPLVHELVAAQTRCLMDEVLPRLRQEGIIIARVADLPEARQRALAQRFEAEIRPVLTPLALDPAHPFPYLSNGELTMAIVFDHDDAFTRGTGVPAESAFALIRVPGVLPRLLPVRSANYSQAYVLLEDLIAAQCQSLFVGLKVRSVVPFRVTRSKDLVFDEDDVEDLMQTIAQELRNRERRQVTRLEVAGDMPAETLEMLCRALNVGTRDIYKIEAPLHVPDLMHLYKHTARRHLKDPPFNPRISPEAGVGQDIFSVLRERDVLLHHPYESFSTVVDLLQSAAEDPDVLAIKQTLYRTAGDSPVVAALIQAAEAGKPVTALVELRARFDEHNNIQWARTLEKAGVHVVYGLMGLKTHCKTSLVVRREQDGLRHYVHMGTGNYNSSTARLYTDLGLMTSDPTLGREVSALFNLLTGYNVVTGARILQQGSEALPWERLLIAPINLHSGMQRLIEDEIEHARAGRPARIIAKMNSLVDPTTIRNLYRASQAGVEVDLIIRGICCLIPGLPGVSERIRVVSILDRFLEHSRVFYFMADGQDKLYVGSADWMPRNFFRRIEAVFPVAHPPHKRRILDDLLHLQLADNTKARVARPDHPTYSRRQPATNEPRRRSQTEAIRMTRDHAIKSRPYQEAIRDPRRAHLRK